MKRNYIPVDEEYFKWLRTQPCAICGHQPKGYYVLGDKKINAIHHVYNRNDNYSVVPLCDEYCDPSSPNCHKAKVHKNKRKYTPIIELLIKHYHDKYEREHNE